MASFASRIVRWQKTRGRHDLPWQSSRDPYRIWISEIMLQQTQVSTVIPYYERFIARFPTLEALAGARIDDVLALWSGLGYYARARNLHRAARIAFAAAPAFPAAFDELVELPGIGRSTAAAIAAFASGERRAILDGNVRRVLARHAAVEGDPSTSRVSARLWEIAESRLARSSIEAYTQGLMDLGAAVCTPRDPACGACPVVADCRAHLEERWAELPSPRRRVRRERRRIAMLIHVDRGQVFLEKRPPRGIWGGLWSLPEIDATAPIPRDAVRLPSFVHEFTHFTLEVTPWRVEGARAPRPRKANGVWLALSDLAGAALPSPVRKLLMRSGSAASGSGGAPRGATSRPSARGASAARRS